MSKGTGLTTPTLLDLMRQRAERYRDKVAFDYCHYSPGGEEHSRLTFHELDIKARAIASTLQRQGAAGERVLVLCPSGLDFIAAFFGGSLLIETIFSLDGLGLLSFESIVNRDYPVVFANLYIFALLGLFVNLLSDLTYMWIDPRVDFETREV